MVRTGILRKAGRTGVHSRAIAWGDSVVSLLGSERIGYAPGVHLETIPLRRRAAEGAANNT
jgi:hypothetical protein